MRGGTRERADAFLLRLDDNLRSQIRSHHTESLAPFGARTHTSTFWHACMPIEHLYGTPGRKHQTRKVTRVGAPSPFDTPQLSSSVPRVNHKVEGKHAHLTQAYCRPRLQEASRNKSI